MNFPIDEIRKDFPILSRPVNGRPLVYFDNGATAQTPRQVVEAMDRVYYEHNSNIHRGIHTLSNLSTEAFEAAREKVRDFINAAESRQIIFTRGTTEAINLVAHSFGAAFMQPGDALVVSEMEHHSNIVPWQLLAERMQLELKVLPVLDNGELDLAALPALLDERTRLLAITHISNVLGTINPVKEIVALAHSKGVKVLIDGAQAIHHTKVDVAALDCDFYVFSGHKMYGPTGTGVLYGKVELLEAMPPWQGGGEMIQQVRFSGSTYNELPYKFEAGTPDYVGVVGLGAAVDYLKQLGMAEIAAYEKELFAYAVERLEGLGDLIFYGRAAQRGSLLSFLPEGIHPFDTGTLLDKMGIAVRTGHHCAQPLMDRFGIPGTVRASFGLYNTKSEVDALAEGLLKVRQLFA